MNRLLKLIVVTLLVIPVATTFAEDKDKKKKREAPPGYEKAKTAEAPARAVNADVPLAVTHPHRPDDDFQFAVAIQIVDRRRRVGAVGQFQPPHLFPHSVQAEEISA